MLEIIFAIVAAMIVWQLIKVVFIVIMGFCKAWEDQRRWRTINRALSDRNRFD